MRPDRQRRRAAPLVLAIVAWLLPQPVLAHGGGHGGGSVSGGIVRQGLSFVGTTAMSFEVTDFEISGYRGQNYTILIRSEWAPRPYLKGGFAVPLSFTDIDGAPFNWGVGHASGMLRLRLYHNRTHRFLAIASLVYELPAFVQRTDGSNGGTAVLSLATAMDIGLVRLSEGLEASFVLGTGGQARFVNPTSTIDIAARTTASIPLSSRWSTELGVVVTAALGHPGRGGLFAVVNANVVFAPAAAFRVFCGARVPVGPERRAYWALTAGIEVPRP